MSSAIGTIQVGAPAQAFVRVLPTVMPQVRTFTFVVYQPSPSLAVRLESVATPETSHVLARARRIRAETDRIVPYWESVLAAAWTSLDFTTFATQAVRHDEDSVRDRFLSVTADDLRDGSIEHEIGLLPDDHVIALDSRCTLVDDTDAHLPLMDFRMLPHGTNVTNIITAVRAVGQVSGAILRSGQSYHYYGFEPLTTQQWLRFCARCLLLSPLTDSRYIAHRILAGAAALRITQSVQKPYTPWVEALF